MSDPQSIADSYAALWNEADPARRRSGIEVLFSPSAEHYTKTMHAKGYPQLEERVRGSFEKNIGPDIYRFRATRNAQRIQNAVTFNWEMFSIDEPDKPTAVGLECLILDDAGKILVDYQFIVQ